METSLYLDVVVDQAMLFVEAAGKAGLDAPVPTCPDWTVADLARHQGRVYRWIRHIIEEQAQEFVSPKPFDEEAKGQEPLWWVKENAQQTLEVLGRADPDSPVWNFLDDGPAPARFWYRRMAHETIIHRADAEAAAGRPPSPVEPAELASDGIDEFVGFVPVRAERRGFVAPTGSYHFHTTDVPGEWVVVFDGDGVTVRREHAKADVAVRGPASDLELFLYSRRGADGLEVFGDEAGLAAWTERIRF